MGNTTLLISEKEIPRVIELLKQQGLRQIDNKAPYERFRFANDNANAILYKTGKLLLQGRSIDSLYETLAEGLISNKESTRSRSSVDKKSNSVSGVDLTPRIGSDEVGKGDYFGPMVVAASYVSEKEIPDLMDMGVTDSKKLSDNWIRSIFEKVEDKILYEYVVIDPVMYSERLDQVNNVAIVLADGHSDVLKRLIDKVVAAELTIDRVVVDQFSTTKKRLLDQLDPAIREYTIVQKHHGESDISVALASIIARAIFLKEWERMEEQYSFKFPKGATNVIDKGKEFVRLYGFKELEKVAKVSFRTTQQIIG